MKLARALLVGMISFFCALPLPAAPPQNSSSAPDTNESGIRQLIADYSDGVNHHDAHAVASLFAEDSDFTNMRGMSHHGRKEIEPFFGTLFSGPLKNVHRTDTVKSIRMLAPDLAAVDGFWEMTGTRTADGTENPLRKGLFDYVVTRQNGRWFILVFHESDIVMPAAAPAGK